MTTYRVMLPPPAGDAEGEAEDAVFLKDRFVFWAFLVPLLWPLFQGLWLVFCGVLAVMVLLAVLAFAAGPLVAEIAATPLSILFALEANSLRAWTLSRRGWRDAGIVTADTRHEAERRFFAALAAGKVVPLPGRVKASGGPHDAAGDDDVLGLFPAPEGR